MLASIASTFALVFATGAAAEPGPHRVVSMNLCTDQLAMLIGANQLYSVSYLATDPESSVLFEQAKRYAKNHGRAEEIFAMAPDLIIAGTYTSQVSVAMLKRLGFRVETFPPTNSLDDIRQQIVRMGDLLQRPERAQALLTEFDQALAAIPEPLASRPLAALFYANSYTSGGSTLTGEIVERAGLENLGARLGLTGTVRLPLEMLVISQPQLVIEGQRFGTAPAMAYEAFHHPALQALLHHRGLTSVPDKYMVCGAPFTLEAVRLLVAAARKLDHSQAQ
ncbi:ABC transporter substrate-binding protein [Hyphomicrobium methylovorum]|uniref:ABC transporter substrate-binding protein n=1 Tax=Hyphomicrobium methylovorum TaxID=84 RepID=UPI001AEE2E57|nr:ABC transporter substrate-binding protein [Hyphomicrobium methylovorum]